jgi:hypothetical protein
LLPVAKNTFILLIPCWEHDSSLADGITGGFIQGGKFGRIKKKWGCLAAVLGIKLQLEFIVVSVPILFYLWIHNGAGG